MKELHTYIDIAAPAQTVWDILADFSAYPQWNPFVTEISGASQVGGKLKVTLQQEVGGKPMVVRPTVIQWDTQRELAWRGRLAIPGVFAGEHHFCLASTQAGHTNLHQWERFTGILIPLIAKTLDTKTKPAFERMNAALKERAEARVAPPS